MILCNYCGHEISDGRECGCLGSYATLKMSRDLWDLFNLRMELIGIALGIIDIGEELTPYKRLCCLERALAMLDVSAAELKLWDETGARK